MSAGNPELQMDEEVGQFSTACDVVTTHSVSGTTYEDSWVPIRAEEFERLPDWCIDIYQQRMKGVLPTSTNEDLSALLHQYFTAPKVENAEEIKVEKQTSDMKDA